MSFIFGQFVKKYLELDEPDRQDKKVIQEKTRMTIDIVANLSEAKAVLKFQYSTEVGKGSFLD